MPQITSPREAGPYSRHVPSLDGLRGMAVLAVMASHLFPGTTRGTWLQPIGATLIFGANGVDLFFVLSGFLITGILFDSISDSGYFRKFYARRTLRIFPLYYGVLFLLFLLTPLIGFHWHRMNWALLFYLQNTNIFGTFYTFQLGHGISLDHFWSLAVEEQFYLVWPLAVFFIRDLRKLLWVCCSVSFVALLLRFLLIFHHVNYNFVNRSTFSRADSLLLGAVLALLLRSRLHDAVLASAKKIFFAIVAVIVALNLSRFLIERHSEWLFAFDSSYLAIRYTLVALGSAALIAWCLRPSSRTRIFFEGRTLRFFGKYSYGLYVLHYAAAGFFIATFRSWILHFTSSKLIGVVVAGFLTFLVAIVLAYASYNLYEKQFLRMKRYFDYDRSGAVKTPSPAAH
ncbi:acyltransferase [Edaphobacter paludis]|uniref:Acyltransferase n=1 Tax=Edaphobacter paludis TaxID=3035702 RepID=A0AAU7D2U8_9BACT